MKTAARAILIGMMALLNLVASIVSAVAVVDVWIPRRAIDDISVWIPYNFTEESKYAQRLVKAVQEDLPLWEVRVWGNDTAKQAIVIWGVPTGSSEIAISRVGLLEDFDLLKNPSCHEIEISGSASSLKCISGSSFENLRAEPEVLGAVAMAKGEHELEVLIVSNGEPMAQSVVAKILDSVGFDPEQDIQVQKVSPTDSANVQKPVSSPTEHNGVQEHSTQDNRAWVAPVVVFILTVALLRIFANLGLQADDGKFIRWDIHRLGGSDNSRKSRVEEISKSTVKAEQFRVGASEQPPDMHADPIPLVTKPTPQVLHPELAQKRSWDAEYYQEESLLLDYWRNYPERAKGLGLLNRIQLDLPHLEDEDSIQEQLAMIVAAADPQAIAVIRSHQPGTMVALARHRACAESKGCCVMYSAAKCPTCQIGVPLPEWV